MPDQMGSGSLFGGSAVSGLGGWLAVGGGLSVIGGFVICHFVRIISRLMENFWK